MIQDLNTVVLPSLLLWAFSSFVGFYFILTEKTKTEICRDFVSSEERTLVEENWFRLTLEREEDRKSLTF